MRLVVKQHRPWRIWVFGLSGLALATGVAVAVVDYGQWQYIFRKMAASAEQREFWEKQRVLEVENRELKERVAMLERSGDVDRHAYTTMQDDLKRQQTQILDMREEVEFYRGILATTRSGEGLKIQGLKLQQMPGEGRYRFKLVLTHVNKDDKVAEGQLRLSLRGGSGAKNLELADLMEGDDSDLEFSFKHFMRFEGVFSLPEGYRPGSVEVAVTDQGGKSPRVQKTFAWSDLQE